MRAERLIAIMLRLQAQGKMTTYALAEELDVSRRTILRDIEALSSAGIPIYADAGHGGGVALDVGVVLELRARDCQRFHQLASLARASVLRATAQRFACTAL